MNQFDVNDSIAAVASPLGSSPRSVIRLSGPSIDKSLAQCIQVAGQVVEDECKTVWQTASQPLLISGLLNVAEPLKQVPVDVYYWPTQASYTRQRSAEIHCIGSPPIVNEIMQALARSGVRQAQPGEFTMRAFLAGRIDLTRAEAVLGVIDSTSQQQMDVALQQLAGGLSGPLTNLQDQLLEMLANIEAGLDFVEEDIEFISHQEVLSNIEAAQASLDEVLSKMRTRTLDTGRKKVVIRGRPNAGKSRLQNALCESEVAIVSDVAGTTRDYLVGQMELDGQMVDLVDTAGTMEGMELPFGHDNQSIQGVAERQADQIVRDADLQLLCLDQSVPRDHLEKQWLNQFDEGSETGQTTIIVLTKCDLPPSDAERLGLESAKFASAIVRVSSVSKQGLDELRQQIELRLKSGMEATFVVGATANRCRESCDRAAEELERARQWCLAGEGDEIVAASLRAVLDELAVVTGKVFTHDILDRVFSNFCIGK